MPQVSRGKLESSLAVTKQEIKWAFENVVSVYSNNIVNYFFLFETAPKQYLFDAIGKSCAENVLDFILCQSCSRNCAKTTHGKH